MCAAFSSMLDGGNAVLESVVSDMVAVVSWMNCCYTDEINSLLYCLSKVTFWGYKAITSASTSAMAFGEVMVPSLACESSTSQRTDSRLELRKNVSGLRREFIRG